jgi:predicted dehydrogenase
MTEPLRVGLVGSGFGGRYFHAPLLASSVECDFLGVVTRSAERRAAVRANLPGLGTFDDLAGLAASGAEAVAISTPAETHIPLVLEALELGLAVVCDKPFALDAISARRAVEEAYRRGIALSVYQNRRWDSDFLTVSDLVRQAALGEVLRFESSFERFDPEPGPPAAGGGTLLDFGSHLVDQALHLFGPVRTVYAELNVRADNGRDDDMFVALTHLNGVRSHLRGSWVQNAPAPRFRVTGSTATYVFDGADRQEEQLLRGDTPTTLGTEWGVPPAASTSLLRTGEAAHPVVLRRGRWDTFYPAFAAAVRGDGPLPVDPLDAVRTAEVLDAARHSAGTGQTVHQTVASEPGNAA